MEIEHTLDLHGALDPALVDLVANRHLRLPVGAEIRKDVRLANLGQAPRQAVRDEDRHRHELVRLARRVAEHHPLVAGAEKVERVGISVLGLEGLVDALRDVGRLLVDRDDDAAGLVVEPVLRARVADLGDPLAHDRADVDVRVRRDLSRDDDEPGRDERLAGDATMRIVGEDRVENGVRDLIGDLVGVTLGHRLRRERERAGRHGPEGYRLRGIGFERNGAVTPSSARDS